MENLYEVKPAKVIKVIKENPITNTLVLKLKDQEKFEFLAGQFMQVGIPGFGECPISISSNSKDSKKQFSLTIRTVGNLTEKLNSLKKGDLAYVRGPFGNGFPEVEGNLVIIGGGCGFIPLRTVYEEYKNKKNTKIQVFIGCKNEDTLVFKKQLPSIKQKHELNLIMEDEKLQGLSSGQGFITDLIKKKKIYKKAKVFVCGPDVMYKFVVKELLVKGINPENIYLSLEKRMPCGVGVCQHCAIGPKYVCKDGPVFPYSFLKKYYKF